MTKRVERPGVREGYDRWSVTYDRPGLQQSTYRPIHDAVLDGAGIKYYPDKKRAMREMLRVVRPGGKVLITELGMPVGRRPTLRQRLLLLWIPGFREGPPLDAVPADATDVQLKWDAAETYFALEFRRPAGCEN